MKTSGKKTSLRPIAKPIVLSIQLILASGVLFAQQHTLANSTQQDIQYNVQAGSLTQALNQFALQAGVKLSLDSKKLAHLNSTGLQGKYSVDSGFQELLRHTDYQIRKIDNGYTVVEKSKPQVRDMGRLNTIDIATTNVNGRRTVASDANAMQLPVINVQAIDEEKSYTIKSSNTATKINLSLKETPQTIRVVTQQQIEDFALTDMDDVLNSVSGVYVFDRGNNGSEYYSRGFTMQTQYDGMPNPIGISESNWNPSPDSAFLEKTEIQQGAAGLLSGAGEPGGTINMVRKRPTQDFQVNGGLQAGSWDKRRVTGDVSGSLTSSGNIRGRLVGVWDETDTFVDYEYINKKAVYGIIEADLTNSTLLSASIQYQDNETREGYGVPVAPDGKELTKLNRSTFIGNAKNILERDYILYTLSLEQKLPKDWLLKVAYNHNTTNVDSYAGSWQWGNVDVETGDGITLYQHRYLYREGTSQSLETYLTGQFNALGRQHDLAFGANGFTLEQASRNSGNNAIPINIYTYDPNNLPEPTGDRGTLSNPSKITQYGVYGVTRLNLTDSLKAILGTRVSWYENRSSAGLITHDESSVISPYGGLIYDINKQYSIYASYSDIFKAQNSKDRTGKVLDPIVGGNYEIGIKSEFLDGALNTSAAIYRLEQTNLSKRDDAFGNDPSNPCEGWCYIAQDKVISEGVDLNFNGQIATNWYVNAGYTFVDSEYASGTNEGNRYKTNSPRHIVTASTTYEVPNTKLTIGANLKAQSAFYLQGTGYRIEQDKIVLAGLMAKYQVNDKIDVSLIGNNLFDETYWAGIEGIGYNFYGEPRNFMLTLRAKY